MANIGFVFAWKKDKIYHEMQDRLDGWILEFEQFMILKNFSSRTIKFYGMNYVVPLQD